MSASAGDYTDNANCLFASDQVLHGTDLVYHTVLCVMAYCAGTGQGPSLYWLALVLQLIGALNLPGSDPTAVQ